MTASGRGSRRRDDDGPGVPGAGGSTVRGALLIAVAVVIGVVLLGKGFDSGFLPATSDTPSEQANDDGDGGGSDTSSTTTTSTPSTTHVPAQVRVIVLNGGGPSGSAGGASTALAAAGFTTLEETNTDNVGATVVYFVPGFDADAAAVAQALRISAAPQPMPSAPITNSPGAGQVDVVVVLGPDFAPVG